MISDLATASDSRFAADICIVGSGVAGIALALQFEGSGRRVLLLESGGTTPEPRSQALYESTVDALPHSGVHTGRARSYGGTSTLWGGQALPLFPIDFEVRPWVPFSGWPLSFETLKPYYGRAAEILHVRGGAHDYSSASAVGIAPAAFDPDTITPVFSQWSPKPNFVYAYHDRLRQAENIVVLHHANVVSIVQTAAHRPVEFLRIATLGGKAAEVRARHYVICAGGIETARLLLASTEANAAGVGNRHDRVGRFFQDHVAVNCGEITPRDRRAFQDVFDQSYAGGVKFLPKLALAETVQRKHRTLNAIGNVVFNVPEGSAVSEFKRVYGALRRRQRPERLGAALGALIHGAPELTRLARRVFLDHRSYSPSQGRIVLEAHLEQEPDPESRITLADERDALGMKRTRLTWRVGRSTWRTAHTFTECVAAEFARLGLGRIDALIDPDRRPLPWEQRSADLNHHMGTTRMSHESLDGVVNTDCRVHEVDNLYVAGSAVFPTSSCSNPTLTLLALTVRLADELKRLT